MPDVLLIRLDVPWPCHLQYVAWNRDSTMVAATTDITGRLFVYSIESRRLVGGGHTKSHGRPCMALSWSPFNSNLLAYAQDAFHVHITVRRLCGRGKGSSRGEERGEGGLVRACGRLDGGNYLLPLASVNSKPHC